MMSRSFPSETLKNLEKPLEKTSCGPFKNAPILHEVSYYDLSEITVSHLAKSNNHQGI